MKTVAAKDAKNRFGQLIDDAQRQPVTVEKNGRPFVVVQSFEDFQMAQQLQMSSLRSAIEEARKEYAEGRGIPFDQAAVKKISATGRRLMSARDRKR
ncbi:MAG: type II toxin-antitoxin system prevent-host-death family antitoxin [Lysobacterales bacterium]